MMVFNICHCQTQLQIEMCLIYFKELIFNGPHVVPNVYAAFVDAVEHKRKCFKYIYTVQFP